MTKNYTSITTPQKRTGAHFSTAFTIVELLIVIIIIAILATITIISYTGIQARAQTAARKSESSQIENTLKTNQVTNPGSYALYGTTQPSTRDDFLSENGLASFSNRLCVSNYDGDVKSCYPDLVKNATPAYDKSKLYIEALYYANWGVEVSVTYWDSTRAAWSTYEILTTNIQNQESTNEYKCSPAVHADAYYSSSTCEWLDASF